VAAARLQRALAGRSHPVPRAAEIDLKKALSHPRPGPLALVLGATARDPLAETLAALRRMARNPSTKAVVLRTGACR